MALRDDMRETFARALELGPGVDVEALKYQQVSQWDSVGHLGLVAAIEDDFGVELDVQQTLELDSFDAAVRTVQLLQKR